MFKHDFSLPIGEYSIKIIINDFVNHLSFSNEGNFSVNKENLHFESIAESDRGNYSVVVSNRGGSIESAFAELAILLPVNILDDVSDLTVREGALARFTVEVSGTEPLSYQWFYGGNPIQGANDALYEIGAVNEGIDMFDCVLPTRSGRTGLAFTWNGRINIRNAKYKNDNKPLDSSVTKFDLNKYSKNYINHLFNTNEMLGPMLLTLNNINFYQELMYEIRRNIKKGTFVNFYNKYANKL